MYVNIYFHLSLWGRKEEKGKGKEKLSVKMLN
jgi:hypothetical protein